MRKTVVNLIIKLLILGIPLYVLMLYAFLCPMKFMPIEYTMWQEEKDYVAAGESVDTVIIGDSRAKSGIIPEILMEDESWGKVYNIAVGGATPIEMYYALKGYIENHGAPERAMIIFAPYHFCDIDNWGQTMSFNYLSAPQLLEVYAQAVKCGETEKLGDHFFTDELSYRLRLPNKYMDSIYNARIFRRSAENQGKYDSVRADGGYTEFGSEHGNDGQSYETHHPEFDSSQLVVDYYFRLMDLCEENGIDTHIVQAPMNETSTELVTDAFLAGYRDMLAKVMEEHPTFGVEMDVPEYNNKYFGDNNHLNREGAENFTAEVRSGVLP